MHCPACESDNPEAARFCATCGSRLSATCPRCQAETAPGARFCSSCGEVVATAEGRTEGQAGGDPPAAAERRRVSVLFVDLANFTALAESMDPEEVRNVQSRYFEVARTVVAAFGGTIEKFIGDAVMAVWGAPSAHEDDAERAIRAAIALVDGVGRLGGAALGKSLRARGGVATGEAAVTIGAIGQGMVAGDLVNIAARLQSRAPVGGVLVDRTTRDRAPSAASFESIGSLSLKGRTGRLSAFRATNVGLPPAGRQGGLHTGPFVGRDRELRELIELFNGVVRERRSRLVSVIGVAGIGKSRLVWELYEWIDRLPDEVAWHAGRAPAYGEGIAFAAVAEMVRRRIRVGEGAPPELARRQLTAALDELIRDDAERRWIEPRLGVLLGRDGVAAYDRDELFAAWRRFFERVAERTPTVLIFEDLQWADPSLLDFIEHLAAWSHAHPILILGVTRPELMDRRAGWGAGVGSFTSIHLKRLADTTMRALLQARAPDLTPAFLREILARAGGIPLYAVEVARIVGDRGPAGSAKGAGRPAARDPEPSDLKVPDSLHGLIAARIDALPVPERKLLMAAAVLGHRFQPDALITVAGSDAAATRGQIDALIRREHFAMDEELNSPGRGQLGFVQDLVREVAYETLALRERRTLHLAAARYLESLDDDNVAEPLARHLVEAHRLSPEHHDAIRLARRAVAALRRAAHDATRLHVPERAVGLLEDALRLSEDSPQRATLLEELSDACRAAGRLDRAEQHLRDLIAHHTSSRDRAGIARGRARLASVLLSAQRNEPALLELESAMRGMRHFDADASGVELAAQLARARLLLGDSREGMKWAERALVAARRLDLTNVAIDALVTRGSSRFGLGEEEAGLSDLRLAIAQAQEAGSLHVELRARNNLAWLQVSDDPRATLETARQGLELATTMGLGDIAVQLADVTSTTAIETGDWAWALETIAELNERGMPEAYRIVLATTEAIIHAFRGDPAPLAALDAIGPIPPETDPQVVAGVLQGRAWCAFVAGELDKARQLTEQAAVGAIGSDRAYPLALSTRASLWLADREAAASGIEQLEALNQRGRAAAAVVMTMRAGLAALDEEAGAHGLYRRAADAWRELDLPLPLALCLIDDQRLTGAAGEPSEAVEIISRLGADGLRNLVEAVSPGAGPPPPARSHPPTGGTARRTDGGRRRQRAPGRHAPPG